jgi:uncharacterized protein
VVGPALSALLLLAACTGTAGNGAARAPASGCNAGASKAKSAASLDQIVLCVKSQAKTHSFTVELARTPAEQAQGLMFRTGLSDVEGMLFPFDEPRIASFWMKNTLIPLDIIFIGPNGKILNIAQQTTPYSLKPVVSTAEAGAVLELRGGLTAQMGIAAGDTVYWAAP